jgi:hypothetical protein
VGEAALVVIHASPNIGWHREFTPKVCNGLKALGVNYQVTHERRRIGGGVAILLGTSLFRAVENGPFLLVDRCSMGDTNKWVTLVRDGHGRRGDHRVPQGAPAERWEWMEDAANVRVLPWRSGRRRVLCGQTETYSPHYADLAAWYGTVKATHFRKHPAGDNPTGLPSCHTWDDVALAITLNSSVAVDAVLAGVPTVTMDEGAMAWDVTGHTDEALKPARLPWLQWLAWTQWSHDEIAEGKPWAHLL